MEVGYTQALTYTNAQPDLLAFSDWLRQLITMDDFVRRSIRYVEIYRQLNAELDKASRHRLVEEAYEMRGK